MWTTGGGNVGNWNNNQKDKIVTKIKIKIRKKMPIFLGFCRGRINYEVSLT